MHFQIASSNRLKLQGVKHYFPRSPRKRASPLFLLGYISIWLVKSQFFANPGEIDPLYQLVRYAGIPFSLHFSRLNPLPLTIKIGHFMAFGGNHGFFCEFLPWSRSSHFQHISRSPTFSFHIFGRQHLRLRRGSHLRQTQRRRDGLDRGGTAPLRRLGPGNSRIG